MNRDQVVDYEDGRHAESGECPDSRLAPVKSTTRDTGFPAGTRPAPSTHSACDRTQLEDRQEHRHDDAADDDAEKHDEERLDQGGERRDRGVALDVVEVRD